MVAPSIPATNASWSLPPAAATWRGQWLSLSLAVVDLKTTTKCGSGARETLIYKIKKEHLKGQPHLGMGQNPIPLVNIKIAGKWMFIPLKMVLIGIDPYPFHYNIKQRSHRTFHWSVLPGWRIIIPDNSLTWKELKCWAVWGWFPESDAHQVTSQREVIIMPNGLCQHELKQGSNPWVKVVTPTCGVPSCRHPIPKTHGLTLRIYDFYIEDVFRLSIYLSIYLI